MATSQSQKSVSEPLLPLVTTRAFVSLTAQQSTMLFTQLPFMPCCRKTQQNTEKDTITVYSTALMAIHRAIYSSNPNRIYRSTNGAHLSAYVNTSKPIVSFSSKSRTRIKKSTSILKIHLSFWEFN